MHLKLLKKLLKNHVFMIFILGFQKETFYIFDELRDLVSFVQFEKRENTRGGVLVLVKL